MFNSENGSASPQADGSFWVICSVDGEVSVCSNAADGYGIVTGSYVWELISKKDRAALEDAIIKGCAGGDVSVTLEPVSGMEFAVAEVTGIELFGTFGVRVRFYRSSDEYLAASVNIGERLGRVFGYINRFMESMLEVAGDMPDGAAASVTDRLADVSRMAERILGYSSFAVSEYAKKGSDEYCICDVRRVFSAVSERFVSNDGFPFDVIFADESEDDFVICDTDPDRVVGIIMMLASAAARMSRNKRCAVTLTADEAYVYIEARCELWQTYELFGRSENFDALYRCVPANPVELMMLENLTSTGEWRSEYSANGDGKLCLRAILVREANPERLKYRDSTANVPKIFGEYADYISSMELAGPQ